jgi:RNA polymerase sigma-70 factor (ECF subfamily)
VDVEAVLQESLLRVWLVASRFRPDGKPNGLLRLAFRIARNHATSEARRLRPDSIGSIDLESVLEPAAPSGLPDPLLRGAIQDCRDKLPPQPARALEQRIASAGNEPDGVLAQRVGMRLNTFLQNVTRARKLIADCLRGRGVDLEAYP